MDLARCMAVALAFATISPASAQSANTRTFDVPGHGGLVLAVPEGWRVTTRSVDNPPSAALRIDPPSGDAFVLQISSVWLDPSKRLGITSDDLKARTQKSAEELLPQAVEKQATLVELHGKEANGYYFSLTDRGLATDAKDYKYATQGTLLVGDLLTVFTFLHRRADDPATAEALRILRNARQGS